ncbi:MAG: peptidylprolyl isomerase [Oscillospiraceae bacterium]|nr:peptidylprolyl isomerase [Oscillospiraceae bacterium]
MICKYCNAQIEDDSKFCPICGMALAEEAPVEETPVEETPVEEAPVEETPVEEAPVEETPVEEAPVEETPVEEAPVEETPVEEAPVVITSQKPKVWPIVLAAVGSVLAMAVLAVVLLAALGVEIKVPTNDIFNKEVYTVSDEKAVDKGDAVVAKVGNKVLTNSLLQIYYRMRVLDFLNYYGSYLDQIGLDYTQPLSEQESYYDKSMTWEQYFIDASIQSWSNYASLCVEAEKAGFTLEADVEAELAKIPASLEEQALAGEYASADAMIKDLLGPACNMEAYMEYIRIDTVANTYYSTEYEKLIPTEDEVDAYFTANEESFAANGITKDAGLVSSVRHILVCPVAEEVTEESTEPTETTDATTAPTEAVDAYGFTESQWAECLAKAEKILQEWKDGEATEESFAALVATYTEDPGSASTGGLYEDINPTSSYVENFLNWSVDMARQPGDTDIVQTEYGYHIMYFVSGSPYWKSSAETQLLSERTNKMIEEIKEKNPVDYKYKNIALSEPELA